MKEDPVIGCFLRGAEGRPADVPSLGCLAWIVVNVIDLLFVFVGAVVLIFFLYGCLRFIVSRGDQKAVQAARNTVVYALIGGVIVVLAFVLVNLATNFLGLPSLTDNFTLYQGR